MPYDYTLMQHLCDAAEPRLPEPPGKMTSNRDEVVQAGWWDNMCLIADTLYANDEGEDLAIDNNHHYRSALDTELQEYRTGFSGEIK